MPRQRLIAASSALDSLLGGDDPKARARPFKRRARSGRVATLLGVREAVEPSPSLSETPIAIPSTEHLEVNGGNHASTKSGAQGTFCSATTRPRAASRRTPANTANEFEFAIILFGYYLPEHARQKAAARGSKNQPLMWF